VALDIGRVGFPVLKGGFRAPRRHGTDPLGVIFSTTAP
jgi:hypothetical protein